MRWKKIPGSQKWIGYVGSHHVATILYWEGRWRMWVDGGKGFQEVNSDKGFGEQTVKEMKTKAVSALGMLQVSIMVGELE